MWNACALTRGHMRRKAAPPGCHRQLKCAAAALCASHRARRSAAAQAQQPLGPGICAPRHAANAASLRSNAEERASARACCGSRSVAARRGAASWCQWDESGMCSSLLRGCAARRIRRARHAPASYTALLRGLRLRSRRGRRGKVRCQHAIKSQLLKLRKPTVFPHTQVQPLGLSASAASGSTTCIASSACAAVLAPATYQTICGARCQICRIIAARSAPAASLCGAHAFGGDVCAMRRRRAAPPLMRSGRPARYRAARAACRARSAAPGAAARRPPLC